MRPTRPPYVEETGGRFIYISVCVLLFSFFVFIFFVGLVKIAIDNHKRELESHLPATDIETIALRTQAIRGCNNIYTYQNNLGNNASDPLIACELEQPPPYIDVVNAQDSRLNLNEPPPPYTSTEALNVDETRGQS